MSPQETARAILAFYGGDASKWTQGALAHGPGKSDLYGTDEDEHEILDAASVKRAWHPEATCWCLAGAAERAVGRSAEERLVLWLDLEKAAEPLPDAADLVDWNDKRGRTFADVVSLLERIAAEPTP